MRMPPRRSVRMGTAQGAVRGAARGAARGERVRDNVASIGRGDEPRVEPQNSGVNDVVEPGGVGPAAGHEMDLQSKLFDHFLKRNPPRFAGAESPIHALEFLRDLESIFGPMGINA